jgi:pimeloyl-ACP methyl ester carboxylesterase
MGAVATKDGTEIFYNDWGTREPIFFHRGWPLSSYPGLPHGSPTTHADQINADLLAFIRA